MSDRVPQPRWEQVAFRLEAAATGPSEAQQATAYALGLTLPDSIPAPLAAIVLKAHLAGVLLEGVGRKGEITERLAALEDELGITDRAVLVTGSAAEVSDASLPGPC